MQNELNNNKQNKGEGWREWKDINAMWAEIIYHQGKLIKAMIDGDKKLIIEHIADCANFYMFIGNALEVYTRKIYIEGVLDLKSILRDNPNKGIRFSKKGVNYDNYITFLLTEKDGKIYLHYEGTPYFIHKTRGFSNTDVDGICRAIYEPGLYYLKT